MLWFYLRIRYHYYIIFVVLLISSLLEIGQSPATCYFLDTIVADKVIIGNSRKGVIQLIRIKNNKQILRVSRICSLIQGDREVKITNCRPVLLSDCRV